MIPNNKSINLFSGKLNVNFDQSLVRDRKQSVEAWVSLFNNSHHNINNLPCVARNLLKSFSEIKTVVRGATKTFNFDLIITNHDLTIRFY